VLVERIRTVLFHCVPVAGENAMIKELDTVVLTADLPELRLRVGIMREIAQLIVLPPEIGFQELISNHSKLMR